MGYIVESLTCLADPLVPVPESISRAQEARGSLTWGPSLLRCMRPFLKRRRMGAIT